MCFASHSSGAATDTCKSAGMVYGLGILTWRGAAVEACGDLPQLLLPQLPEA